ncbi:hypothetical protein MBLNU457_3904t1 [Dothideomycetes sp. NU457]
MKHMQLAPVFGPLEISTFGYQLACHNRFNEGQLSDTYDLKIWPAIFVYDILQLPGTLANVLGYSSSVDVTRVMTPAKYTHESRSKAVNELQIGDGDVQGMVVLGRGRDNRRAIADYYGDEFKRQTIDVEISLENGHRVSIEAYAWIPIDGELEETLHDAMANDTDDVGEMAIW